MKEGIILPGKSAPFEFSARLFGNSYMWKVGDSIVVSFIVSLSPRRGNFRRLVESMLENGYTVKVPTPIGRMRCIVESNGYEHTIEYDDYFGCDVDVWVKRPAMN